MDALDLEERHEISFRDALVIHAAHILRERRRRRARSRPGGRLPHNARRVDIPTVYCDAVSHLHVHPHVVSLEQSLPRRAHSITTLLFT